jgi:hypothetical protein
MEAFVKVVVKSSVTLSLSLHYCQNQYPYQTFAITEHLRAFENSMKQESILQPTSVQLKQKACTWHPPASSSNPGK